MSFLWLTGEGAEFALGERKDFIRLWTIDSLDSIKEHINRNGSSLKFNVVWKGKLSVICVFREPWGMIRMLHLP